MTGIKHSLLVLIVLLSLALGIGAAVAQANTSTPIGPQPLLPCTQSTDDSLAAAAQPTLESLLAELEPFLARIHDNPFDPHVEQIERCYPLYFEPEAWPTMA